MSEDRFIADEAGEFCADERKLKMVNAYITQGMVSLIVLMKL